MNTLYHIAHFLVRNLSIVNTIRAFVDDTVFRCIIECNTSTTIWLKRHYKMINECLMHFMHIYMDSQNVEPLRSTCLCENSGDPPGRTHIVALVGMSKSTHSLSNALVTVSAVVWERRVWFPLNFKQFDIVRFRSVRDVLHKRDIRHCKT